MTLSPPATVDRGRYKLVRWSAAHAASLRAALTASDAHLRAWTPWVVDGRVPGMSLEDRLAKHDAQFVAGDEWVYGLFSADEREVLGGCGLYPRVGPGAVELGYWLAAGHTGRGLATDAARTLTTLAFESPNIDRVEIRCDPRNVASARVPERLGYRHARTVAVDDAHELMVWELSRAEHDAQVSMTTTRA